MNTKNNPVTELNISELIDNLGEEDYLKRQHARLLLVHREDESVPALLEALQSAKVNTRWEAVKALGEIRNPETIPALIEMLMDEDTGVRWAAMESLIRNGRNTLRPLLEKFIKDFDSLWLREGTHHILRVLKDRHELNQYEIAFFEELNEQPIPGFESGWTSEQAWSAEKALEVLDRQEELV